MIHVDRTRVPLPDVFAPGGRAAEERREAEEHYGADPPPEESFDFDAYRDPDVKKALEILFHGKCAYCESRYAETQPMDVEHWRPKKQVIDGDQKLPGYYWLAADWQNLLPSCIDCNRRRKQILRPGGEPETAGKANQFPLADPQRRAGAPGEEDFEDPLLLHPCHDEPAEHLEFAKEGVLRPRLRAGGTPSPKGRASIDVYALNRSGLVHSRREMEILLRDRMRLIRKLAEVMQELEQDGRAKLRSMVEDLLTHELVALRRFLRSETSYSALARQLLEPFLQAFREQESGGSPEGRGLKEGVGALRNSPPATR